MHYAVDILHHYYGVVDHDAYGKDKPEKGHHVKCEAEKQHNTKGADKRDRNSHKWYKRGSPALQ